VSPPPSLIDTVRGRSRRKLSQDTEPVPFSPWPILLSVKAKCGSAVGPHSAKGFVDAATARLPCCRSPHAQPSRHVNQQVVRTL